MTATACIGSSGLLHWYLRRNCTGIPDRIPPVDSNPEAGGDRESVVRSPSR